MQDAVAFASHAPRSDQNANDFALLDRYWRAANYLSVGQIYLLGNPLLREPLLLGLSQAMPQDQRLI